MPKKSKVKTKKPKFKLPKPKIDFFKSISSKVLKAHSIAIISLIPAMMLLWIAFPTFSIEYGDKIYNLGAIQIVDPNETLNAKRVGFKESLELQGGDTFKIQIQLPADTTDSEIAENQETETPEEASSELSQEQKDQIRQTVDIIRRRIDSLDIPDIQVYELWQSDREVSVLVNLSGSREQVGLLPFYLSLSGNDVTIWTDDPSFTAAENPDEQTFNPLEGLRATGLVREDITGAYTVNDFRTRGNGLKLNFTEESGLEFTTEASQIISSGFALVIDGQPVASQSYPMTSQLFTQGYSGPYTVYMTNFISGEKIQFQAIASIINNEPLPLVATVETSTNSNIQSLIDVDPLQMKGILFAALILSLIIIFIKFRYNAIIPIVFAGNSLILSIGIMKLMGLYLNINLIIGVIIGLGLLYLLGMIALKKLLKVEKSKSEIIAKASSEFRWSTLKFLLAILLMTLLIDVFEISFAKQLSFGIGVMTVTGLISLFSVFRAFVNELFILPSTVGDAK